MKLRIIAPILAVGLGLGQPGAAQAAVNLRFAPADASVATGATGRLSIMVDDADADVRTIDLHVAYDAAVVGSLDGGAGAMYTASGYFTFQGFENDVPGQWHGYAVVMGAGDHLEGPGELYYWEFEGLTDGISPVVAVEAYVAAGDGTYYSEVILDATTIVVGDPFSGTGDLPARRPELEIWPNPFNPSALLTLEMPEQGNVRLSVFDLRGRELAVLHEGSAPAGVSTFLWNGRDQDGSSQPAGQYLFNVTTRTSACTAKALLVK